ncbi:MAG: FAD-dependent oxidoreductase [Clostridia bacterium]|nr:FAD-dependent oxidoreductase [Clostridia bacterium]
MKTTYDIVKEIRCNTFVAGGGVAGSSAAIASARGGAKTILCEMGGTLGGQAGIGLVTPLSSVTSKSRIPFGGLVKEIVDETSRLTEKYVIDDESFGTAYNISPHILKYVLLKMASDAGVNVRFHTVLCDAETENGRIKSVIIKDKSGYTRVIADTYIDATGDADLVYLSEDNYVLGSESGIYDKLMGANLDKVHSDGGKSEKYHSDNLMQPVSLFFVMRGVDYEKASSLNNKNLYFGDLGITKERFEKWEFCGTPGFEIQSDFVPMPQNRVLMTRGRHSDEAVINMSRVININGADGDDLSRGEVICQLQLIAIVDFLKTFIPGFEKSYLVESSSRLGVRETRRLVGKYKLSGLDLINGSSFPDTVACGYYMIDIHDPQGKRNAIGGDLEMDYFEIPYRSLCSEKYNNLLVCGRCISCDHIAHSATRIQGCCITTGNAVGVASALTAKEGIAPCDLSPDSLRESLKKDGIFVGNNKK